MALRPERATPIVIRDGAFRGVVTFHIVVAADAAAPFGPKPGESSGKRILLCLILREHRGHSVIVGIPCRDRNSMIDWYRPRYLGLLGPIYIYKVPASGVHPAHNRSANEPMM